MYTLFLYYQFQLFTFWHMQMSDSYFTFIKFDRFFTFVRDPWSLFYFTSICKVWSRVTLFQNLMCRLFLRRKNTHVQPTWAEYQNNTCYFPSHKQNARYANFEIKWPHARLPLIKPQTPVTNIGTLGSISKFFKSYIEKYLKSRIRFSNSNWLFKTPHIILQILKRENILSLYKFEEWDLTRSSSI